MSAAALLSRYPATVPGWHVTGTGIVRGYISKVAKPGPAGAPKDPWGRPFEAGSLHPVTMCDVIIEFRGMVHMRGNTIEIQLINS